MGYINELRNLIGTRPLVTVGASVVILNEEKEVLMVERTDNNLWGLPAGSTELNEEPVITAIREVKEETGLTLLKEKLQLIQVFGGEAFFYTYPNGDQCSNVVISYLATKYSGELLLKTKETKNVKFYNFQNLPENISNHEKIILAYYQTHIVNK